MLEVFAADSAPKQGAAAAVAVAFAVIPYCMARAISELGKSSSQSELETISETLSAHTGLLASIANETPAPAVIPDSGERIRCSKCGPEIHETEQEKEACINCGQSFADSTGASV